MLRLQRSFAVIDWLAIPVLFVAAAQVPLPEDVAAFIGRRQLCDHFRGEEPYDAERRAFLDDQMHALCHGTDHELARLRAAYATRADVLDQLAEFEDRIEPCAISGAAIQWQADYCLMETQTDDLIAAEPCLKREGSRRFFAWTTLAAAAGRTLSHGGRRRF